MKLIDRDLHLLPAQIRFKFLDLLGVTQKTLGIPKPGPNIVEHFLDKDRMGLEKRTETLSKLYGGEGNVVTAADAPYELTTGRRPYHSLKYHNSSTMIAKCLSAKETKTKGIYNLRWGILPGKEREFEKDKYVKVGGKIHIEGGHTFSTKENPVGKNIIIELETFNLIYDEKAETYEISAWAPRFLGVTDLKVDSVNSVIDKAIHHRVFQGKVINPNGEIEYYKNAVFIDNYEEFSETDDDESKMNKIIAQIAKLREKAAAYQQKDEDKDRRRLISDQLEVLEKRLIKLLKDKNLKSTKIEDTTVSIRKIPDFFEITSQTKAIASLKKVGLGRFLREEIIIDLDGLKGYLNKEENKDIKLDGVNRIGNRSALYIYKKPDENSEVDLDDLSFQSFYEMPYDPTGLENEVLMDDYRLVMAHWSTWCSTNGQGIKFNKEQIMDVALKVVSKIKERILARKINFSFRLNEMKPISKSLYLKIRYQLPPVLKDIGEILK